MILNTGIKKKMSSTGKGTKDMYRMVDLENHMIFAERVILGGAFNSMSDWS